jgi:hypothetical protein
MLPGYLSSIEEVDGQAVRIAMLLAQEQFTG